MDKELLKKYIDGLATETERKTVVDWVGETEENRLMYNKLMTQSALKDLPYTLSMDSTYKKRVAPVRMAHKHTILGIITKVAAVLFLPLMVYNLFQLYVQHEDMDTEYNQMVAVMPVAGVSAQQEAFVRYEVNPGVKGFIDLPDGSKVWLNSNSSLSFPVRFDSIARQIQLKGEAYFEVKSDPRWPMYITCKNDVVVKVTGTEFNLTTYEDDNNIKLLLVSGKLDIIDHGNERVINVNQSEQVIIYDHSDSGPEKDCPVIYNSIAWKEGFLVFENTIMSEVIKRLERWYGVQIKVENEDLLNYRFTATFGSESLDRVLNVLKISSNIDYQIDNTTVKLKL